MNGIEELQQRVQEAEQRFGLIHEQGQKYSERLIALIVAIEDRQREFQSQIDEAKATGPDFEAEITQQKSEVARTKQENEQLRTMLRSLLQAVEAGNSESLIETMQFLETKASALAAPRPGDAAQPAAPVTDPPRLEALDRAEDSWPSLDPAPIAETPASESMYAAGEANGTFQAISEASIALEPDFPTAASEETRPLQAPQDLEEDTRFEQADMDLAGAREIAAKHAPNSGFLGDIMDRVSRLVKENDDAAENADAVGEETPGRPATEDPDLKTGSGGA